MLASQGNIFHRNGKKAVIVPVFKEKYNNSFVSNYRTKSLLNNVPECCMLSSGQFPGV